MIKTDYILEKHQDIAMGMKSQKSRHMSVYISDEINDMQ